MWRNSAETTIVLSGRLLLSFKVTRYDCPNVVLSVFSSCDQSVARCSGSWSSGT